MDKTDEDIGKADDDMGNTRKDNSKDELKEITTKELHQRIKYEVISILSCIRLLISLKQTLDFVRISVTVLIFTSLLIGCRGTCLKLLYSYV